MSHPMQRFQAPEGWRPEQDTPSCDRGDFAASREPPLDDGVDYVGPYDILNDGIGEACRRHALALDATGLPVFLSSNSLRGRQAYHSLPADIRADLDPLTTCRYKAPLLRIVHSTLGRATILRAVFPGAGFSMPPSELARLQKTTIIMTVHERLAPDQELKELAPFLNMAGEVWVPSTSNKQVLVESGVRRHQISVIPHPYDPEEVPLFSAGQTTAQPRSRGRFVFFSCGKWEPRKALHELIGAFLSAFRPSDGAWLAIKTSPFGAWRGYPSDPASSLRMWLSDPSVLSNGWNAASATRFVLPIFDDVPRRDLIAMHREADCYVCCSRAEGFALPVLDAKLAGKRVVYTPCGGPEDLVSADDVQVQCESLASVREQYGWGDAKWAGFTVAQLAAALREAFSRRFDPAASMQLDRFHPSSVGATMRQRIDAILHGLRGP